MANTPFITRRSALRAITGFAATTALPAAAPCAATDSAQLKADELGIVLASLHGGDWRVQFEPEHGLVLIARRF